jgi:hypothetical protein
MLSDGLDRDNQFSKIGHFKPTKSDFNLVKNTNEIWIGRPVYKNLVKVALLLLRMKGQG